MCVKSCFRSKLYFAAENDPLEMVSTLFQEYDDLNEDNENYPTTSSGFRNYYDLESGGLEISAGLNMDISK